jgi:hypothetical protein
VCVHAILFLILQTHLGWGSRASLASAQEGGLCRLRVGARPVTLRPCALPRTPNHPLHPKGAPLCACQHLHAAAIHMRNLSPEPGQLPPLKPFLPSAALPCPSSSILPPLPLSFWTTTASRFHAHYHPHLHPTRCVTRSGRVATWRCRTTCSRGSLCASYAARWVRVCARVYVLGMCVCARFQAALTFRARGIQGEAALSSGRAALLGRDSRLNSWPASAPPPTRASNARSCCIPPFSCAMKASPPGDLHATKALDLIDSHRRRHPLHSRSAPTTSASMYMKASTRWCRPRWRSPTTAP